MKEQVSQISETSITMKKLNLEDANILFIPVMNSISKFCMRDYDLFSHFRRVDVDNLQRLMCKYIKFTDTNKPMDLIFLSENIHDFVSLTWEFLEFNFGFFSQALKIAKKIGGILSEREEEETPNDEMKKETSGN